MRKKFPNKTDLFPTKTTESLNMQDVILSLKQAKPMK